MALFNIDYFNTLDRGYYSKDTLEEAQDRGTYTSFPEDKSVGTSLTPREIGTTMAPDTYPIQELQAKIRQGAAKLEIEFAGAGKSGFGGRGSTPEVIGKLEREQFRELARLNDVKVTTHATFGKQGLSGFTQNGFNEEEAQRTLKEINKAIDFAAEATNGGAVVFHTGEWQRPIMDAGLEGNKKYTTPQKDRLFSEYEKEYEKAHIMIADERTGQFQALNREMRFYFPEEEFDKKTGINFAKLREDGTPIINEYSYDDALRHIKEKHKNDTELMTKSDPEILLYGLNEQKLTEAKGQALRFTEQIDDWKKQLARIQEKRKIEEQIWEKTPQSEQWKLMELDNITGDYTPKKDDLKKKEKLLQQQIEGNSSTAVSSQEQYERIRKEMNRLKPIEEVGIRRTADTLAKAGIKAMQATQKHKELKEPIYIAPENVFAEYYGSHADELINIVEEGRKDMTKRLVNNYGYKEDDAKKKAKEHIKATFDTGHFNTWRQHFQAKQNETPDQTDARFKEWYLKEVKKMIDKGIIGHVHLTDNFGYDDEHLTPGQGNTPTREVVKMLEDAGIKDFIAEVGSFNANTILSETLSELGSPVYALGKRMNFTRMHNAHFGYSAPPNYIVGAYAPSNEFRLWSEVPLE